MGSLGMCGVLRVCALRRGACMPGVYDLVGFVSHIGKNTTHGHYVAHIRKGGKWYIFNDRKVQMCVMALQPFRAHIPWHAD